jgi:heme-degrading monooxygenase HmoA
MDGYAYIWEFIVAEENQAAFEQAYGPQGQWVALFRQSPGYLGTDLLKDKTLPARYVTVDRWASAEAYQAFRAQHGAAYAAIDAECEYLTEGEHSLGEYVIPT